MRKGWQGEHLAKYIISKFAFVAEPSTIADDLGSDFFCTTFDVDNTGSLSPQSSFAIQIKSNKSPIQITKKLSYFEHLELPFFVGVVNNQEIDIYSGESIPHFFSLYGYPTNSNKNAKVFINLIDNGFKKLLDKANDADNYYLYFPKVVTLMSNFDYKKDKEKLSKFFSTISKLQKNVSRRASSEYLFELIEGCNSGTVIVYAGSGSVLTYKKNLLDRLAEAFYNIFWIANKTPSAVNIGEFEIYEEAYLKLSKGQKDKAGILMETYIKCKEAIENLK